MTTLRDLFTEKDDQAPSLYHNDMLSTYKNCSRRELYDILSSPVADYAEEYLPTLRTIETESARGKGHLLLQNYQHNFCRGLSDNMVVPFLDIPNLVLTDLVVLSHPDDCERVAKNHTKKIPNFVPLLYDSIISTTDTDHWKDQRLHFVQAFSPMELGTVMQMSQRRASQCSELLWKRSQQGKERVNMSEFFLNETMAQLQLAMFGLSGSFQEETNAKIRAAFGGAGKGYARDYAWRLLEEARRGTGPLSEMLRTRVPKTETEQYGNALIFSFAGHDTTGHTLTWLVLELAKNQSWQRQLQREVDRFWTDQKGTAIRMSDFKRLPFMTRCIMETLRLHTAVPNGTFRELTSDATIHGKDGPVTLPKGTYVQIFNYSRHVNPELWGDGAAEFDPTRKFEGNEIWNEEGHAFYNPSSKRFSPFTYGPRDCIGKNFAQMEMRLMLLYLMRDYHFILDDRQNKHMFTNLDSNVATMGPVDVYEPINKDNKGFRPFNNGMYVHVLRRSQCSAL